MRPWGGMRCSGILCIFFDSFFIPLFDEADVEVGVVIVFHFIEYLGGHGDVGRDVALIFFAVEGGEGFDVFLELECEYGENQGGTHRQVGIGYGWIHGVFGWREFLGVSVVEVQGWEEHDFAVAVVLVLAYEGVA